MLTILLEYAFQLQDFKLFVPSEKVGVDFDPSASGTGSSCFLGLDIAFLILVIVKIPVGTPRSPSCRAPKATNFVDIAFVVAMAKDHVGVSFRNLQSAARAFGARGELTIGLAIQDAIQENQFLPGHVLSVSLQDGLQRLHGRLVLLVASLDCRGKRCST